MIRLVYSQETTEAGKFVRMVEKAFNEKEEPREKLKILKTALKDKNSLKDLKPLEKEFQFHIESFIKSSSKTPKFSKSSQSSETSTSSKNDKLIEVPMEANPEQSNDLTNNFGTTTNNPSKRVIVRKKDIQKEDKSSKTSDSHKISKASREGDPKETLDTSAASSQFGTPFFTPLLSVFSGRKKIGVSTSKKAKTIFVRPFYGECADFEWQNSENSGRTMIFSNAETNRSLVKMQGNTKYQSDGGVCDVFIESNSKVSISDLGKDDVIHVPSSKLRHDGLPQTCSNTEEGALIEDESRNILLKIKDRTCLDAMKQLSPEKSFDVPVAMALQKVTMTPFFYSSLMLHGIAFLTAFRDEIVHGILKTFAAGNNERYIAWKEELKKLRNLDSVNIIAEVGEMGIRIIVPKDLKRTENATRIAKDFIQAVTQAKQDPKFYCSIIARMLDGGADALDMSMPYVSIHGLTQILLKTYQAWEGTSAENAANIFINNLALLIPGSRVLMDTLDARDNNNSERNKRGQVTTIKRGVLDPSLPPACLRL